jgi:hypothetical protein
MAENLNNLDNFETQDPGFSEDLETPQTEAPVADPLLTSGDPVIDPPTGKSSSLQNFLQTQSYFENKLVNNPLYRNSGLEPVRSAYEGNVGEKYLDAKYGFSPVSDEDDFYGKMEPWYKTVAKAPVRLLASTGIKIGEGVGFVGGLFNPNNWDENIISKASDNAFSNLMEQLDEDMRNEWLPTYQEAVDRDKGFFGRAFTDLDFWTDDVVDGVAFVASAWIPGLGLAKLQAGTKLLKGASYLGRIGAATAEEAVVNASKVQRFILNAEKYGQNIDKFNAWAYATASEAMFEAAEVKKKVKDSLSAADEFGLYKINPETGKAYTEEEKNELAGKAARNTFLFNAALLAGTNSIELNWLGKLFNKSDDVVLKGAKNVSGTAAIGEKLTITEPVGKWAKFIDSNAYAFLKGAGTGILVEGGIEENGQLAISRVNEKYGDMGKIANTADLISIFDNEGNLKLPEVLKQYFSQTVDILPFLNPNTAESRETAMNIGLGGILGGGMAGVKSVSDNRQQKTNTKNIVDFYNSATDNWLKAGNVYETEIVNIVDPQGNTVRQERIKLDQMGNPIVNKEKLAGAAAQFKGVYDALDEADKTNDEFVAKLLKDTAWSELTKAYIKLGREDQFLKNIDSIAAAKPEELVKLGFATDDKLKETTNRYKQLAKKIIDQNKLINSSIIFDGSKEDSARKNHLLDIAAKQAVYGTITQEYEAEISRIKSAFPETEQKDLTDGIVSQINDTTDRINSQQEYLDKLKSLPFSVPQSKLKMVEEQLQKLKTKKEELLKNNEVSLKDVKQSEGGYYVYKTEKLNEPGVNGQIRKKSKKKGELLNTIEEIGLEWASFADMINGKKNYSSYFTEMSNSLQDALNNIARQEEDPAEQAPKVQKVKITYTDDKGVQKTGEISVGSFYVGPVSTTARYAGKGKKPVTTFNNDLVKVRAVNPDGTFQIDIYDNGKVVESVTFSADELGNLVEKWNLYDNLSKTKKLYLKLRNKSISYRVIKRDEKGRYLKKDPKTGQYPTRVVEGRVGFVDGSGKFRTTLSQIPGNEDKEQIVFVYMENGKQYRIPFDEKYVVNKTVLTELPTEEQGLLQEYQDKLDTKFQTQKEYLSNLIQETEQKLGSATARRSANREQILGMQRDLESFKSLLDQAQKELEKNPYSGKGRKSKAYLENQKIAEELTAEINKLELQLAELTKEREELQALISTLDQVKETYYEALIELDETGQPFQAGETGVIYSEEEQQLEQVQSELVTRSKFSAEQVDKMLEDTKFELALVEEEIEQVNNVLDQVKKFASRLLSFQEVANALMDITDRQQLLAALRNIVNQTTVIPEGATEEQITQARQKDKDQADLAKNLIKGIIRGDKGIEAQYALELMGRYKEQSDRLNQLIEKQKALTDKVTRLQTASDQLAEISALQDRIAFLKTVQEALMAEYGKEQAVKMAQKQAKAAEVLDRQASGNLSAEDEVSRDNSSDAFERSKPILTVTSLLTSAGLHYKDEADTELNTDDNNHLFFKLTQVADLNADEYYLMAVTADNENKLGFPIRREDIYKDDIKLVVVKKVGEEYKYVDQNGNVLETPTEDTLVYTSMRGNDTLLGKDRAAAVQQVKDRFTTTGLTDAEISEHIDRLIRLRDRVKAQVKNGETVYLKVTGKSKGVPVDMPNDASTGLPQELPLQGRLIAEDTEDFAAMKHPDGQGVKLVVVTSNDKELGRFVKPGRLIVEKQDGTYFRVFNRQLSAAEKENLIEVLKLYSVLNAKRAAGENTLSPDEKDNLAKVIMYLNGVLFWSNSNNASKSPNKFYINTETGALMRGDKPFIFSPDQIEANKDALVAGLYHQVNDKLLKSNSPFFQVIVKNGKVNQVEFTNYAQYLLGEQDAKGKDRQLGEAVVYTSNVPTYGTEASDVQLKSIYFTFEDPQDPYQPKVMQPQGSGVAAPVAAPFPVKGGFFIPMGGPAAPAAPAAAAQPAPAGRPGGFFIPMGNAAPANAPAATAQPAAPARPGGFFIPMSGPAQQTAAPAAQPANPGLASLAAELNAGAQSTNPAIVAAPSVQPNNGTAPVQTNAPVPADPNAALARILAGQSSIPNDVDFGPENQVYRLAMEVHKPKTEKFKKVYAFFRKNLPNIPVNKVAQLIDNKAWGAFKRGAVYIYENAEEGTGFHEAFEAVWNAYLTTAEQQELAKAFRSKEGQFTNPFTNETKNYADASMYDVREMLAEEFRGYILDQSTVTGKIKQFFKDLWNFIKSVLGMTQEANDIIEQTFRDINKGKFANAQFARDPALMGTSYSVAIPGTTQEFSTQVTEGLVGIFFMHLKKGNNNIDALLAGDVNTNKLLKDLFQKSWLDLEKFLVGSNSLFEANYVKPVAKQAGRELTPEERMMIFNNIYLVQDPDARMILQTISQPLAAYNNLKLSLGKFGIEFKEVTADETEQSTVSEENVTDTLGIRDSIKIDPRRMTAVNFRVLIGTLTEDEYNPAAVSEANALGIISKKNRIGLPKLVDFDKVHNMLINELNGTSSSYKNGTFTGALETMFSKLDAKYKMSSGRYRAGYEWIYRLKNRLKYAGVPGKYFTEDIKQDDVMLLVGFEKSLLNKQNIPLKTIINENNLIYDMNPITSKNEDRIRDEWSYGASRSAEPLSKKSPVDLLGLDDTGLIVIDRNSYAFMGNPKDNTMPYLGMPRITFGQILKNLKHLGINFTASEEDLKKDRETIEQAYIAIKDKIMDGSIRTMDDLYNGNIVGGRINALIAVEAKYTSQDNVLMHYTASGEPQYSISLPSLVSNVVNSLNAAESLADFVRSNPQFGWVEGDVVYIHPYQSRSQILKQGGMFFDKNGKKRKSAKIDYHVISGMADSEAAGRDTDTLTYPDKVMQEIHYLLNNVHYTIINSDKSTEFALGLTKPFISYSDVLQLMGANGSETIMNIYLDQLADEMDAAIREQELPSSIQYYSKEVKRLGHFRDILGEKLVDNFVKSVLEAAGDKQKNKEKFLNKKEVSVAIEKYIKGLIQETTQGLIDLDIFVETQTENGPVYSTKAVGAGQMAKLISYDIDLGKIDRNDLEAFAGYLAISKEIAVAEQHKLIYGHPVLYKDLAKRANGANSTKDGIVDNQEVIKWMDVNMPRLDGKKRSESELQTFKNISFGDMNVVSEVYKEIAEGLYRSLVEDMSATEASKKVGAKFTKDGKFESFILKKNDKGKLDFTGEIKIYLNLNEADGQAWIMPDMYRDMMFLSAKMSKDQLRQWEYEKAYEIVARSKKRTSHPSYKAYTPEVIAAAQQVLDQGNPGVVITALKPQYFGYAESKSLTHTVFLKHSVQPKFYRTVEGTQFEGLYVSAQDKQIDIIGFESGQKLGSVLDSNGKLLSIYNQEGEIDTAIPQGMPIQNLYTKFYGLQQEVPAVSKYKVVRGSQVTKLIQSNFTDDEGNPINDRAGELIREYNQTLEDITKAGEKELLEEMGLIKFDDGSYATKDINKLVSLVRDELQKRDLPSNLIDGLAVSQDGRSLLYRFDTLANREKIDNVINKLVDSRIISPKMFGKAAVQVASTGFETLSRTAVYLDENGVYQEVGNKKLTAEQASTVQYTSNELKFYRLENGKIQGMEVYLPWFFRGASPEELGLKLENGVYKVTKDIDPKLLEAIAFRIPTQGMNSIEYINIKGFLPQEMGDQIVVPSEIVGKSGSDFDIDKLNIYLSNYAVEPVGKDYGSEEFKEFLRAGLMNLTEDGQKIYSKEQADKILDFFDEEDLKNINRANYTMEGKEAKGGALALEEFIPDQATRIVAAKVKSVITRYNASVKGKKRLIYVEPSGNNMDTLQNKLKETMQELISMPENYRQLMMPNGAATLKSLATDIRTLKGLEEPEKSFTDLRKFLTMAEVRERYLSGKRLVGIAALQQTSHTISQVAKVKLTGSYDASRLFWLYPKNDNKEVIIRLPHNRTANKELYLYAKRDQSGRWISEMISEALTGFVDAAKDPFVFDLNLSIDNAGTWFYLQKLGVKTEDIAYLFSQPLVEQYLNGQAKNKSFFKVVNQEKLTGFQLAFNTMRPYIDKIDGLKDIAKTIDNLSEQVKIAESQKNKRGTLALKGKLKKEKTRLADALKDLRDSSKIVKTTDLRNAIQKYHSKGNIVSVEDAKFQLGMFLDYLEYAEQSRFLTQFVISIGFDTARTKTVIENDLQLTRWERLENTRFIANPNDVMKYTFLGEMKKQKENLRGLFKDLFVSLHPKVAPAFEPLFEQLNNLDLEFYKEGSVELVTKYQNFVISHIVQTTPVVKNGMESALNSKYEQLVKGAASMAKQLKLIRESSDPNISQNLAVRELIPVLTSDSKAVDNIKLFRNRIDTYKNDILIESIMNLRNYAEANNKQQLKTFVDDLASFALMQSGLQPGSFNYTKILPIEVYTKVLNDVLNTFFSNTEPVNGRLIWKQFHQNNARNSVINPVVKIFKREDNGVILVDMDYAEGNYSFLTRRTIQPYLKGKNAVIADLIGQGRGSEVFDTILYENTGVFLESENDDKRRAVFVPINKLGDGYRFTEVYSTDKPSILEKNNNIDPATGVHKQIPRVVPQTGAVSAGSPTVFKGVQNSVASQLLPQPMKLNMGTTPAAAQPSRSSNIILEEDQSTGYKERTVKNASADATIALAVDFSSAGEKLTKSSVESQGKKYIARNLDEMFVLQDPFDVKKGYTLNDAAIFNLAAGIVMDLNSVNAKTLNIAGNGIYTMKGKYSQALLDQAVARLIEYVFYSDDLKTKITSIRTGGQTGVDEAGAKAGVRLGIPTTILAPKGWKFRNEFGQDISSEKEFKARFSFVQPPITQPIVNADNAKTPIEGLNERVDSYGDAKVLLSSDFYEGARPVGRLNSFKSSITQVADNIIVLADLNLNEFNFLSEEDKKRLDGLRPLAKELQRINVNDISSSDRRTVSVEKRYAALSNQLANEFVDIIGKHVEQQLGKKITSSKPRLSTAQPTASTVRPTIDLSKKWSGDLESRAVYTPDGINTMRTKVAKEDEHFGNPWSESGVNNTINTGSIPEAAQNYRDWLLGTKYQSVKPKQRQWILDQINQGKLDGKKLLYSAKLAGRGQGMHPTALADVVEQLRSSETSMSDAAILASPEYKKWAATNANPMMTEQENLDYYKTCKLN